MIKIKLVTFQQALTESGKFASRHLLLGNGFSIACIPSIFTYTSLYGRADFSEIPEVKLLFERLGTMDFELVIRSLENASVALPIYLDGHEDVAQKMREDAIKLKELLIRTVAENHPAFPSEIEENKYLHCINFLKNFMDHKGKVYTFNYDLLLYWTVMYGMENKLIEQKPLDGFGRDTDFQNGEFNVSEYLTWQGESTAHHQNIHYLHGALHLYDNGAFLEKFTWNDKNVSLIDQARKALSEGRFPLFVSEGECEKKLEKITHCGYLYHSYKSFSKTMEVVTKGGGNCLFTFGVSFTDNDDHVLKKIASGKVKCVYVSIYGNPDTSDNQRIIAVAEALKGRRSTSDLEVYYYDALSAKVWG
ncbi:DUF4917 family protein [Pedobacter polaris]|uniref:DUF4917 family protein n=1 Tax=Pedobacter polaris TaxID=2571273 RepID=UPI0019803EC2|nr:DUF4917 family protein [Pedobacter polaris]